MSKVLPPLTNGTQGCDLFDPIVAGWPPQRSTTFRLKARSGDFRKEADSEMGMSPCRCEKDCSEI